MGLTKCACAYVICEGSWSSARYCMCLWWTLRKSVTSLMLLMGIPLLSRSIRTFFAATMLLLRLSRARSVYAIMRVVRGHALDQLGWL